MPFSDRFWWLKLADGLLRVALGEALLAWLGALEVISAGAADQTGIHFGVALALLTLGIGVWRVFAAKRGRRRRLARLAAIAGDHDAVPVARLRAPNGSPPEVANQPLVIAWRMKTTQRVVVILGVGLAVGAFVVVLAEDGSFMAAALISTVQQYPFSVLPLGAIILLLIDLGRSSWATLWRDTILAIGHIETTASEEGILYKAPLHRPQFVAWPDARLLEVWTESGAVSVRRFILYGTTGASQWYDKIGRSGNVVPVGVSADEQAVRATQLLELVHARTGLVPRTFDRELLPPPLLVPTHAPATAFGRLHRRLSHVLWLLVVVAILLALVGGLLALAAVIVVVPLTTLLAVNLLVAAGITAPVMAGVVAGIVKWREPLPTRARLETARDTISSPSSSISPDFSEIDPSATYLYTVSHTGKTARSRLVTLGLGVALTTQLLPGAIGLFSALQVALPGGVHLAGSGGFQFYTPLLLAIPGLIGPVVLLSAVVPDVVTAPGRTIRALPDALEADGRRVRWDTLEGIDVLRLGGRITYVVWSTSPASPIFWTEELSSGAALVRGSVNAAGLARIVEVRSGVPLTRREL